MKIALAADHGGFELKEIVKKALLALEHQVVDVGCTTTDSVDYPDYAEKGVAEVISGSCSCAILICGTGIGMSIAANRHRAIRAANCHDAYTAKMSREHNDANVLCLGARVIDANKALDVITNWLGTDFGGGRHQRRIAKFSE